MKWGGSMKIAICGDVHWSQYSSIIRKRGEKYSVRLENLINSVNWFNQLSTDNNCVANFYLGDFFDKAEMNAEEISALSKIKWSTCIQYFLCGNHEMIAADHKYSSAKVFDLIDRGEVFDEPTILPFDNIEIGILPYILESNRKPLTEYLPPKTDKKRLILSHNDIKGIQMGKFVSEAGFSIEELEADADLILNGHLHNGDKVSNKIINVGVLSGMNFSEDAFKYDHVAFIVDTDTLKVEVYENPWALNFYKIDAVNNVPNLHAIKQNAVITLKCNDSDAEYYKKQLNEMPNVLETRVIIQPTMQILNEEMTHETLTVDHLESFKTYILNNFENTKELIEELNEVLK